MWAIPPRSSGVRESMFVYRLWWNVTKPLESDLDSATESTVEVTAAPSIFRSRMALQRAVVRAPSIGMPEDESTTSVITARSGAFPVEPARQNRLSKVARLATAQFATVVCPTVRTTSRSERSLPNELSLGCSARMI